MEKRITKAEIAAMIDHTLLKQDASEAQIRKLCEEARAYHFASVCVNPCYVKLCAELLSGRGVSVCTVIGFPLGASTSENKAREAAEAVQNGAQEVDMVANAGQIRSGAWEAAGRDIAMVREAVPGAVLKVIIEACLLTEEEKEHICRIAKEAGADFVKTSTGFSTGGATAEDVALMRRTVGPEMGVKAAGGIRTAEDARKMVKAGASRIGASAGIAIVEGWEEA